MEEELREFLKSGDPWESMATDIPSVFIVKVPPPKSQPEGLGRLMIEVNPVDESGKKKKRKGLFVSDREMYYQFLEALQDDRINKLLLTLESINPEKKTKMKKIKIK